MDGVQSKTISIVAVSVAVVVAAWAAMRVFDDRRDIADASARKAASNEQIAKANREIQTKAAIAEEKAAEKAKHDAEKAKSDAEKAKHDAVIAKENAKRAADEKAKAESDNRTAREKAAAEAKAAADSARAAEEQAKAEKLALEREKNAQRAAEKAAADKIRLAELEAERARLGAERATAEAQALELRRMHLEELEQQLLAIKRDLDEREAALKPELTIKDLATTDSEEKPAAAEGPVLPENDPANPRGSRALSRSERRSAEQMDDIAELTRSGIVARLEKLYVDAVREDRVTDANFYRKELKRLIPGWEYKPPKKEEGQK